MVGEEAGLGLIMPGDGAVEAGERLAQAGSSCRVWGLAHTHAGKAKAFLLGVELVLQVGEEVAGLDAVWTGGGSPWEQK